MVKRTYDSTVARIAGNLLSGTREIFMDDHYLLAAVEQAVRAARLIVHETERTEPASSAGDPTQC